MIKLYETNNFYLRPFTKEDITDRYLSWFHDQEVTKYTSHGLFKYTKEMAIEFLENADKKGDVIWAIVTKLRSNTDDSEILYDYIGNIALQNINWINLNAEFAGIIGEKEYWGKGIGTEAIGLLFNHGFKKLNLHKIYLGTARQNTGMRAIALNLGMKEEGNLRDHVFLNGYYQDIIQYGILKDEWKDSII